MTAQPDKTIGCGACGAEPGAECDPFCTAAAAQANEAEDAAAAFTPTGPYLVLNGTAYGISPSKAPSASYLVIAPIGASGDPDSEGWTTPDFESMSDPALEALAKIEAALYKLPSEVPE